MQANLNLFCNILPPSPGSPKDFSHAHLRAQDLMRFCVAFLYLRGISDITITSVVREDGGTHQLGKCIDFDVEELETSPKVRQALSELMGLVQTYAPYGVGRDGKWHWAFVWEVDAAHRNHVHTQVK